MKINFRFEFLIKLDKKCIRRKHTTKYRGTKKANTNKNLEERNQTIMDIQYRPDTDN